MEYFKGEIGEVFINEYIKCLNIVMAGGNKKFMISGNRIQRKIEFPIRFRVKNIEPWVFAKNGKFNMRTFNGFR